MSDKNNSAAADNAAVGTTPPADPNFFPLDTPIIRGEQRIDGVTLRKPQSGELRGLALTDLLRLDVTALHVLLPRITTPALTQHDVQKLDPADLVSLGGGVVGFFTTRAEREMLGVSPTE